MSEIAVRPNWASSPGETILAVLYAKGVTLDSFRHEVGLSENQTKGLLTGSLPVTPKLARSLSKSVGSTPHFWMERQRQYRSSLEQLAASEPELRSWSDSFPVKKMIEAGWLPKPYAKVDLAFELLDFFAIDSVEEWRNRYASRLGALKFRTSGSFSNDVPTTLAWIRRGELLAENIKCAAWNRQGFLGSLPGLKYLSKIIDPGQFLPRLQEECAKHGVAVVVARSISGCAASGATMMLDEHKAMLLLSARFLSDDQFWFSFFHEAGHLVLHGNELHVEYDGESISGLEMEANRFAEEIILEPAGEAALQQMQVSPYSIARIARQCGISEGVIVGQLQYRRRISPKLFNKFKTRYAANSFTL